MKIFVNSAHEIRALYSSNDPDLMEIEIDRESVFGDLPDIVLLGYCYKAGDDGVSIWPRIDLEYLQLLARQQADAEAKQAALDRQITDLQEALTDVFESMVM